MTLVVLSLVPQLMNMNLHPWVAISCRHIPYSKPLVTARVRSGV